MALKAKAAAPDDDKPDDGAEQAKDQSREDGKAEGIPLQGTPLPQPKCVDLEATLSMGDAHAAPVDSLPVRELKGIGATFSARVDAAMTFRGIVYQRKGDFHRHYQLLGPKLLRDPRLERRVRKVLFVPVYAWGLREVVLNVVPLTNFGQHILDTLQRIKPRAADSKVWVEWDDIRRRHRVFAVPLTSDEKEELAAVAFPGRVEILDALQLSAFDDIEKLAAENEDIANLLRGREV